MANNYRIKSLIVNSLQHQRQEYGDQNAGFTMAEMIVVLFMIGILSVIAAPGWSAFINRQRLNQANGAVASVIQETRLQAKSTKGTYSISFRVNNNIPEYIIYPGIPTTTPITNPPADSVWIALGDTMTLRSREVFLYTNLNPLTEYNTTTADRQIVQTNRGEGTITFDSQGVLANNIDGTVSDTPLAIMVAAPVSTTDNKASSLDRCVIIQTLIGGIRIAKDERCRTIPTNE
ncbi:MAG: prepilin-type N-terminal cleavage/methylation domain-containing protein [Nostocales cyanobacterium W4_Combined_metabat2_030]|jgi:prepilin-type N-terminal cleavage/methylation domain-containing protein|nr:prepilin-type N-terminal cleavage/methylation domain-containing protein [Nostocales cyanobacterium W4_Combined_metabat2_030]